MREKFVVFETKFIAVLSEVKDDSYSLVIDNLMVLISESKSTLSKSQVLTLLFKIHHEFEMNEFQETVFFEIEKEVESN